MSSGGICRDQSGFRLVIGGCPRQDSNLRSRLRRPILCLALTWQKLAALVWLGAYGGGVPPTR